MSRLTRAVALSLLFLALAGANAVASADETELVVSFLPSRIRLNPKETFTSTEAQIYTAIYEGLVTYHPLTVRPVPAVASSWTISDDGTVYTFTLRESARYWNGDRVLAQHFVDTWLALLDQESEAAYSFLFDVIAGAEAFRTGENADPASVGLRAVSPGVLEVRLAQPAPHFLDILAHHSFVPVHPQMLGASRWDRGPEVISNGAYRIAEWSEAEMVLIRNERYWDRRNVRVPQLRFVFREDAEAVARAFNDGEIHWVTGGVPLDKVARPQTIVVNPLFATTYFFFVSGREPWSDPRVRRAMALLLPWQRIRDPEIHFAPTGTLVPVIPGYPEVVGILAQDLDEAFELLEQAGFPEGKGLPPVTIRTPGGVENGRIAGVMRDAWRDYLDLETVIEVVEFPDYFDSLSTDTEFTLATISWIGDFADPLTFLQMWTSTSNLNESGFVNHEYDELVRTGSAQRGAERFQTLSRAERMLLETAVVMPISHSPAVNLIDLSVVGGWYPNPLDIHPFKHLRFIGMTPAPGVVRFPGR
ncbi:MAG: peptide ABC transporter substrate-binding protein [Spirochaetaceae bacterium]|nr:MAG: peptide ABC transporter substrate-binding protein [Spirochaetaceae bacterium]